MPGATALVGTIDDQLEVRYPGNAWYVKPLNDPFEHGFLTDVRARSPHLLEDQRRHPPRFSWLVITSKDRNQTKFLCDRDSRRKAPVESDRVSKRSIAAW